jgi:hypothetical protein
MLLVFSSLGALVACAPRAPGPVETAVQQPSRVRPYPIVEGAAFARAVERGTRTHTGRPGARYWTNSASYRLEASLDPRTRRVNGYGTVTYRNRSPDTLTVLAVYTRPNLFAPGAMRNRRVPTTAGIRMRRVAVGGTNLPPAPELRDEPSWFMDGTVTWIRPEQPVLPGDSIKLTFDWYFEVPRDGAPRGGTDGSVYFVSYWYPQMAVYDDLGGWQTDPYLGNAEFYMGWGDYEVLLTVPAGWLIGATGELLNANAVLTPRIRGRLDGLRDDPVARGGGTVHVVEEGDRGAGRATQRGSSGRLTWHYRAHNVRDFAWGASSEYLWDASLAPVGDGDGDGRPDTAVVHTLYRPDRVSWAWDQSARYARHSLQFLSKELWAYPYPQVTAVDGPTSCGGMEYPMITCIGGPRDTLSLYSVTVHELGHMWFPMQVGSNETRHSWQDEGLTRFNQAQAMRDFFPGYDLEAIVRDAYLSLARADGETELMRHGDRYPVDSPAFGVASYQKMSTILSMLRGLLGDEMFWRAYREYGRRWIGGHPVPLDFWHTFEDMSGEDLGWFWRTWFYETWTLDHAIDTVAARGSETVIVVSDLGRAPMPARLVIRRADGTMESREVPVTTWLAGATRFEFTVPTLPAISSVELDPGHLFPDIDRRNDRWPR